MPKSNANPGFGCLVLMGDGGIGAGTKASLTKGTTNSQIVIKAAIAGTASNGKTVVAVASGNNTPLSVTVTPTSIAIALETDGSAASVSTVNDVIAKLYADEIFQANFDAEDGVGDGTGVLAAFVSDVLAGGTAGAEVFTPIAEITGVPGVGSTQRTSEVTHMTSEDGWAEHIALGIKEQKSFTVPLNFVADDPTQIEIFRNRSGSKVGHNYQIKFTDDSVTTLTFFAFIVDTDIGHDRDSHAQGAFTFLPSGKPEWDLV